jgi:hypothetical protein
LPPVAVRRCPAIAGYRLLPVAPPGGWVVFRGAFASRKGRRTWKPRDGSGGGSILTQGGRVCRVAHYRRIEGAAVAYRCEELSGWRPVRRRRKDAEFRGPRVDCRKGRSAGAHDLEGPAGPSLVAYKAQLPMPAGPRRKERTGVRP